ncbi:TolC family protein [Sinomicrobium pectinilyticum]|uniref:TolC family protein n=1 Tax=Sinomicrobium pectinilyticum TaxID=1084421 RepID=A0A3N0F392_SINP1|nr:TolC family protein [Sinomicrobium pectinilyticum]RNL94541.1 TolC family protein [Sinomicrobium pectinilyticum]
MKVIEAPVGKPESFSSTGYAVMPDKWWTTFRDEQLNILMDSAFANNMNLTSIWYQLKEAEAIRKTQSTFLLPDIEANAQTAISRPKPDFAGGENTQLGLSADYEVDLWGRIRTDLSAEDFRLQATYYDYQAAAMTLSAEIAIVWFQLLTTKKQLKLATQQIETNQKIITLIRARFGGGQIKGVDILRQRQLLEEAKDQYIIYETNLNVLRNQLAVFTGVSPQDFTTELRDSLPDLPDLPVTGLPLELIRRRPDLQREYNLLLAADRDMAAVVRNKFPRLSLNLSMQARSNEYRQLFSGWAYTLGANLLAPILYWGRLRAEVDRTEAVKMQQLYQYGQTVLTAFQEVENALIREENQFKRLDVLENRLSMAEKVNKQLHIEFLNGFTEYLDVLLALEQQQQLQRDWLETQQELYEIRIDLYRTLAGGFNTGRENEANTDSPN